MSPGILKNNHGAPLPLPVRPALAPRRGRVASYAAASKA